MGIFSPFVRSPVWEAYCGVQNLYNSVRLPFFIVVLQSMGHHLAGMKFDFIMIASPPTILLWQLLCLWTWDIFFWWVLASSC